LSACVREASVRIRVILVMSLVALGSGAASTEPLFSPMFGEVIPPRPPRPIGGSTSHQPDLPPATPGNQPEQKPAAATAPGNRPEQKPTKKKPTASTTARMPAAAASPVKQPEQKSTKQPEQKPTAAAVLAKPGVVTIGHSAATPRPTESTSQVPTFPAAQTLE
jgi:outer membrane biosynthesis protein TonB